jgi:hypothetical protein
MRPKTSPIGSSEIAHTTSSGTWRLGGTECPAQLVWQRLPSRPPFEPVGIGNISQSQTAKLRAMPVSLVSKQLPAARRGGEDIRPS